MPPSNNVITSFLSTLIGQPHFGAEGPRNASIVTRRTFPYVGGATGHETRGYSLGPRPSRDSRTKEGLGTLVDFLGTPARFRMVQSDCRISLVTQLSRSNSRVTATQTPPPGTTNAQVADHALVAEMRMRISMCQTHKMPRKSTKVPRPSFPRRGAGSGNETKGGRT